MGIQGTWGAGGGWPGMGTHVLARPWRILLPQPSEEAPPNGRNQLQGGTWGPHRLHFHEKIHRGETYRKGDLFIMKFVNDLRVESFQEY